MTQEENLRDTADSGDEALSPAEQARQRKAGHARSTADAPRARRAGFHPLSREPKSTVQIGDVRYLDGAELSRPLETPPRVRAIMLAAMAVAAIVGCLFLGRYFDQIMNEPIRQQQTLQENLAREVSYDFPLLSSLMPLSDEEIMTALNDAGYTLYERTPVGTDPDGGFEVIKLPADVSLEEAGLMYVQGIDKLSASDAVRLLKGAWTLTVTRKNGDDMRLRYADFASGTIEKAVQGAMQVEGLENAEVTDSGVDDSGNTYQAGVVTTDNGTYNWRVSVIELSEVYDISGLPNTAFYVGIRFTAQA